MPKKNNPIKNFFSTDLHIKIFSLIVAITAWFCVMNTIAPLETKIFTVPIKFENTKELMSQGYIISNMADFENQYIDIGVEATRPSLDELSKNGNENAIYAKVDLSSVSVDDSDSFPQTFTINVQPTLPSYLNSHSYNITSYSPAYISIEVDRIESLELELDVKTTGNVPNDYEIAQTNISQKAVTVRGPKSKINQAATAAIIVDVNNITEDTTVSAAPVVYDKNGKALDNFVVEPGHIGVELLIHKKNTVPINQPQTTGVLPSYLELSSIDWSPKSVNVTGSVGNTQVLSSIDLEPVNLSEINADTVISRNIENIITKSGLTLKNPAEANVTITVKVKLVDPETITINGTDIKVTGLPESKNITLPEQVKIEIAGIKDADKALLNPSIDVTGLSDGKHSVKLNLTTPPNSAISSSVNIDINIQTKPNDANTDITTTAASFDSLEETDAEDDLE